MLPLPPLPARVVQVLLFARLSREAGVTELSVSVEAPYTVAQLGQQLQKEYGLNLRGCMAAVNEDYATLDHVLNDSDEVAFLPPVSGGQPLSSQLDADTYCEMTEDPLLLEPAAEFLVRADCGAQAYFVGTVRSPNDGQEVEYIDYEGFVPMAYKVMQAASQEVRAKHGLLRLYIQHRLGRLLPTEASILIGVASPHRRAALEACDDLIEYLKRELPVWKYEQGKQGDDWVQGQTAHETF